MSHPAQSNPADMYEQYYVPAMFAPWATVLLQYAAPQLGERVLDVACGTGVVARHVAPMVGATGQVVGVDLNPAMLAVARTRQQDAAAPVTWQEGNALDLPFAPGSFDLVVCQHGLPFMPDYIRAVGEMRRVLAPGGRAVVMVLQALTQHPVFAALGASVARKLSLTVDKVMTPFAVWDADEFRRLFMAAGFTHVDVHAVSIVARFPEPDQFAPLAVVSSAAAVPAFAQLATPERAALVAAVSQELAATIAQYRDGDAITFPMFAHLAVARMR